MKKWMTENEMEILLQKKGYKLYDETHPDDTIDSTLVFDYAICELGYTPYRLEGTGLYNDTYIFVLEEE